MINQDCTIIIDFHIKISFSSPILLKLENTQLKSNVSVFFLGLCCHASTFFIPKNGQVISKEGGLETTICFKKTIPSPWSSACKTTHTYLKTPIRLKVQNMRLKIPKKSSSFGVEAHTMEGYTYKGDVPRSPNTIPRVWYANIIVCHLVCFYLAHKSEGYRVNHGFPKDILLLVCQTSHPIFKYFKLIIYPNRK